MTGFWNTGLLEIPFVHICPTCLILTSTLARETGPLGRLCPRKQLKDFSENIRYGLETGEPWSSTSLVCSSR